MANLCSAQLFLGFSRRVNTAAASTDNEVTNLCKLFLEFQQYLSRPADGEPQQLKSRARQKRRETEPEEAVQEGKEGMNAAAGSIRLAFEALSNLFTRNLFSRDVNTDGCDGQTLLIGLCRRLTMRRNSQPAVRPKERERLWLLWQARVFRFDQLCPPHWSLASFTECVTKAEMPLHKHTINKIIGSCYGIPPEHHHEPCQPRRWISFCGLLKFDV